MLKCVLSKLGPNLQAEVSLSLSCQKLCEILCCQERWEERRGRGKSQEKVQVTLFFFLETNSGWTQGDARQFTKSQALLSHFSKPCNLEQGPNLLKLPPHRQHYLTFKSGENPKVSAGSFYFYFFAGKTCAKLWLIRTKCRWIRAHVKLGKIVLPPYQPCVYF